MKDKTKKRIKLSKDDVYEVLKIKTIQEVENEVKDRLYSKLKIWGVLFTVAIGLAGFLGFTSFWNVMSSTIEDSVDSEVNRQIEPRLNRLEERIETTWESSILAKQANQEGHRKF